MPLQYKIYVSLRGNFEKIRPRHCVELVRKRRGESKILNYSCRGMDGLGVCCVMMTQACLGRLRWYFVRSKKRWEGGGNFGCIKKRGTLQTFTKFDVCSTESAVLPVTQHRKDSIRTKAGVVRGPRWLGSVVHQQPLIVGFILRSSKFAHYQKSLSMAVFAVVQYDWTTKITRQFCPVMCLCSNHHLCVNLLARPPRSWTSYSSKIPPPRGAGDAVLTKTSSSCAVLRTKNSSFDCLSFEPWKNLE